MKVKNEEDRAGITESGRRLGAVLEEVAKAVHPGVSTLTLNELAERLIREGGDEPAFLDYTPEGAHRSYPATLCVSVNEEVVHGIPNETPYILRQGDIISLDLGLIHKGYITDSALTVPVGKVSPEAYALMNATEASLTAAIAAARPGNRVGDISAAAEAVMKDAGFAMVRVLGGHGVGKHVHEEPFIPNVGYPGTGPELVAGMVLALEPIGNAGKASIVLAPDGYTYRTRDGSISAHFEHTILIEEDETHVLTRRPSELD